MLIYLHVQLCTALSMYSINCLYIHEMLIVTGKGKVSTTSLSKVTKVSDDLMPRATAIYDFDASNNEEISFKEGDTLYLLTRVSDDWYEGENTRTGKIGQFPTSFINVVEPLP